MTHHTPRPPKARGFTLVELLVVIGIIALLISILLPTLNSARASAKAIACASNLRQVGQGIVFYTNANDGFLPWGWLNIPDTGDEDRIEEIIWWAPISVELGVPESRAYGQIDPGLFSASQELSEVLLCQDALPGSQDNAPSPAHYTANERLMPFYNTRRPPSDQDWTRKYANNETPPKQVKVGSVGGSAGTAVVWDGPQVLDWKGGSAWPRSANADQWRLGYHGWFGLLLEPGQTFNWAVTNYDLPLNISNQEDPAYRSKEGQERFNYDLTLATLWQTSMRFRHGQNTKTNLLFLDGHVEARQLGEVRARDVAVDAASQWSR